MVTISEKDARKLFELGDKQRNVYESHELGEGVNLQMIRHYYTGWHQGYPSYNAYLEGLAKKRGFNTLHEYSKDTAEHNTRQEYAMRLAEKNGGLPSEEDIKTYVRIAQYRSKGKKSKRNKVGKKNAQNVSEGNFQKENSNGIKPKNTKKKSTKWIGNSWKSLVIEQQNILELFKEQGRGIFLSDPYFRDIINNGGKTELNNPYILRLKSVDAKDKLREISVKVKEYSAKIREYENKENDQPLSSLELWEKTEYSKALEELEKENYELKEGIIDYRAKLNRIIQKEGLEGNKSWYIGWLTVGVKYFKQEGLL